MYDEGYVIVPNYDYIMVNSFKTLVFLLNVKEIIRSIFFWNNIRFLVILHLVRMMNQTKFVVYYDMSA